MDALHEAYVYAAGISLSTLGLSALHHLYFYHVQRAGMKIRVAMCHVIYRKVSASVACFVSISEQLAVVVINNRY